MATNRTPLSAYAVQKLKSDKTANLDSLDTHNTPVTRKRSHISDVQCNDLTSIEDTNRLKKRKINKDESNNYSKKRNVAMPKGLKNAEVNGNGVDPHKVSASRIPTQPRRAEKLVPCGNEAAVKTFNWLISPTSSELFFEETWEKRPLHIKRSNLDYYKDLFSCKDLEKIIKENHLNYSSQIDVLTYVDGERQYETPGIKVNPSFIWDAFERGNSIRHRNPQSYHKPLWNLCSLLQEYFASAVGVNMYLTPAGAQGFPPHYDDIEAFVLQIEGKKHWKVYKPRAANEVLPRYSSRDFREDEIGTPCMEIEVSAGDLLYFPRGYIHQAKTDDTHSLHLTLSTHQLNTWGDLLQLALPTALKMAIENEVEFRKSLPQDYLDYVGFTFSDRDSEAKNKFECKALNLSKKCLEYLNVHQAADHHALSFIHGSMPPFLDKQEKACSIHGHGSHWEDGKVAMIIDLQLDTKIRLIRKRSVRLIMEEDSTRIYYTLENSKNFKENELVYLEIEPELIEGFRFILQSYPNFVTVEDLPLDSTETKVSFAQAMYDHGLLMTEKPLPMLDPEEIDSSEDDS